MMDAPDPVLDPDTLRPITTDLTPPRWSSSFSIVIDTREQKPYDFAGVCRSTRETLPTGDYSIAGAQRRFCVERKSADDAYQSFTKDRERFVRELERMATYDYAAIVLEFDYASKPPPHVVFVSRESIVGSVVAWSVRYGVHVWFASGRAGGRDVVVRLARAWQQRQRHEQKNRAAQGAPQE